MDHQQTDRLRALWKSGREKYLSFFAVLEEVRKEIGDEALPSWCVKELQIGLTAITNARNLLVKADADRVAHDLAEANAVQKRQRETERQQREAEKRRREIEEAEHAAAVAKLRADTAAEEERLQRKKKPRNKQKRSRRPPGVEQGQRSVNMTPQEWEEFKAENETKGISNADVLGELVRNRHTRDLSSILAKIKEGEAMCREGYVQWIEGSILKAKYLCAARELFPADRDFGDWLAANGVTLNNNERAALIGLGRLGEEPLREILANTDRRAYQYIWKEYKPKLTVVEDDGLLTVSKPTV